MSRRFLSRTYPAAQLEQLDAVSEQLTQGDEHCVHTPEARRMYPGRDY